MTLKTTIYNRGSGVTIQAVITIKNAGGRVDIATTIGRHQKETENAYNALKILFGQMLFLPVEKLIPGVIKDCGYGHSIFQPGQPCTLSHDNVQTRITFYGDRSRSSPSIIQQELQELHTELMRVFKENMHLQFWRCGIWDNSSAPSGKTVGKNKLETEFAENYIFNEFDTEYGAGTDADFRREKRKLDLIHGKIVEFSRHNGIKHPAYPSAQVRALCTKFYGQETHPEFGRFTHGRFERDPFTKQ